MSNCSNCNEHNEQKAVPYIVHESAMARCERTIVRLWVLILVLIVLLVGTNAAWLWYESQFETVEESITIEADQGDGVNIVGGGDIDYGAESEVDKDNANSQA